MMLYREAMDMRCYCRISGIGGWRGGEVGEPSFSKVTHPFPSPLGFIPEYHTYDGCFKLTEPGKFAFLWRGKGTLDNPVASE